jgi:hypothetical protein
MANILLLDPAGALVDFGIRCLAEGHSVKQWIKPHGQGVLRLVVD